MTWELRYMGAIRGREREGRDPGFRRVLASLVWTDPWICGPPTQMETGSSVSVTFRPAGYSLLSALCKTHGCARQDCSCQPAAYCLNSDSSLIITEDIGEYASMLHNKNNKIILKKHNKSCDEIGKKNSSRENKAGFENQKNVIQKCN